VHQEGKSCLDAAQDKTIPSFDEDMDEEILKKRAEVEQYLIEHWGHLFS
jgi:poly(3-hydroxybutyrate) depolymerase